MNLQNGRGSVSTAGSSGAWKAIETVPDQFLAGLRMLLADDDPACLMILEKMLRTCLYEVQKKKNERKDVEQSGSVDEGDRQQKPCEGTWKNSKKRKNEDEHAKFWDDISTLKKPRVVWSAELHQQFVGVVNQLGIDKAAPKKILELMNDPGLTRDNVASHLQKYRRFTRQHQSNLKKSYLSSPEASFGLMSSLNGIDLQTLAATGQLPAQSLAALQAAGLGRSTTTSGMPMPLVDQLEHQSAQSLGAVNMQVNPHGVQNSSLYMIGQPQSRGQIMNESIEGFVPSYDNELPQQKSNDWNLPNVGLTFDASHHANSGQGSLDSSGLVRQGFSSNLRNAQSRNPSSVGKPMFPMGASTDHGRMNFVEVLLKAPAALSCEENI